MSVPTSLALTGIVDDAEIIAADHRNNYSAIQTAVNALISFFSSGVLGATLRFDGTDWAPTTNFVFDDSTSTITLGGDVTFRRSSASVGRMDGSLVLGSSGATPDQVNVLGLANAVTPGTPSSGGFLYTQSGALKYKGSSGTVTTLASA